MGANQIEARTRKSFTFMVSLLSSIVAVAVLIGKGKSIYQFRSFNPDGYNFILLFILLSFCLYWWLNYFDKTPKLKIDEEGIWVRENFLPQSTLKLIRWKEIEGFRFNYKTQKAPAPISLLLSQSRQSRKTEIPLLLLDVESDAIAAAIRYYALIYKIPEKSK